jgi:hypothetical protein
MRGFNHKLAREEAARRITSHPPHFKGRYFHSHRKMKPMAKTPITKGMRKQGNPNPWKRTLET